MKKIIILGAFIFSFLISVPSVLAANNFVPKGWFSAGVYGTCRLDAWTCDQDNYGFSTSVNWNVDGTYLTNTPANQPSDAGVVAQCGGTSNHSISGYILPAGSVYRDGVSHTYQAYGVNIDSSGTSGGSNTALNIYGSATMTCANINGTTSTTGGPGIAQYSTNLITEENGSYIADKISKDKKWRAKTTNSVYSQYNVYNFDGTPGYWGKIINAKNPPTVTTINPAGSGSLNYYKTGDISVASPLNFTKSTIVLVVGNLTVNRPITRANKKVFVAFFVKGNIILETGLAGTANNPAVDGVFYADGTIGVPTTNTQLFANGIFVALQGFNLSRDLGSASNSTTPAEVFSFDPSLIINAPTDLMTSLYYWKEIAP